MKIELKEPFKSKWKFGYLVVNSENRRNIILYNSPKERTTISYARYLMSVSLGKEIQKELVVDHIDNDQTNDTIENLQLLTLKENNKKAGLLKRKNNHGTLSCYRYCKCTLCVEAHRNYYRIYHKNRK